MSHSVLDSAPFRRKDHFRHSATRTYTISNPDGSIVIEKYDAKGKLMSRESRQSDGSRTVIRYDANGCVIR